MTPLPPIPPTIGRPGAFTGDPLASDIPCGRAPWPQFFAAQCLDCADCLSDPEPGLVEAASWESTGADGFDAAGMVGGESPSRVKQPVVASRHETPAAPSAPESQKPDQSRLRLEDLEDGARRLAYVMEARLCRAAGLGWEEIGRRLGIAFSTVFKWCDRVKDLDAPTATDLATRRAPGSKPQHGAMEQDEAVLRGHYLITNRTADAGSAEEAARMALRRGELSPALAQRIRDRDAAAQPLLPESLRKKVIVAPAIVKAYRNPTESSYSTSCPGTLKFVKDRVTGQERYARAGDLLEMDDATINFPVCVPWDLAGLPSHKCADLYGVIVGRFQWLVCVDVAEMYVPGWSYTARPRSSYRGEDVLATLLGVFRQHGVWERARFERGVFESNLVKAALERLRIELHTVHSPHTKPFIEGLFNLMWTKLSGMPGQVGRFRGEMEEESALIESCKTGAKDPRKYFPMLADAKAAFAQAIADRNSQWVKSNQYGKWIPEQRWQLRRGEGRLRPLDASSEWIFSPCVREWTVKGTEVGGSVNYCEGLSIRYDFSADWLWEFDGERVQLFFDPFAPQCEATLVLVNRNRTVKGGTVLGKAVQVNKTAQHARRIWGYGDDEDNGVAQAKRNAQAVRREVQTILPGGKPGVQITTVRDGEGRAVTVETGSSAISHQLSAIPPRRGGITRTASPEEFRRQSTRVSRLAAAQAALMGEPE